MWAVYDLVTIKGKTVYVGMSACPEDRHQQHRVSKAWARSTDLRIVRWYAQKRHAKSLERKRIKMLQPLHNRQYSSRDRAPRMTEEKAMKIWHGKGAVRDKIRRMHGWTIDDAYQYLGTADAPGPRHNRSVA